MHFFAFAQHLPIFMKIIFIWYVDYGFVKSPKLEKPKALQCIMIIFLGKTVGAGTISAKHQRYWKIRRSDSFLYIDYVKQCTMLSSLFPYKFVFQPLGKLWMQINDSSITSPPPPPPKKKTPYPTIGNNVSLWLCYNKNIFLLKSTSSFM